MNDPLGLFAEEENKDPLGLFEQEKAESHGEWWKSPIAQIGTTADLALSTLAGSAAALAGDKEEALRIEEERAAREKTRAEWANPSNRQLSFGEKLGGTALTLPMQIVTAGLSPAETEKKLLEAGETKTRAGLGAAVDVAGNIAGMVIPGFKEGGALVRGLTGAGANMAQEAITKAAIRGLAETEQGKKQFETSLEDLAISGLVGGAAAMAAGRSPARGTTTPEKQASSILDALEQKQKAPLEGQGELFPETLATQEGHATPYEAGQMGVTEPISPFRQRRQMELQLTPEETLIADRNGVVVPEGTPNMDVARQAAREAEQASLPMREQVQGELFTPEVNMTRPYDLLADNQGKKLSFEEFVKTTKNLSEQEGTRFRQPEDMRAAYKDYLDSLSYKQPGLFDLPSRQELPSRVEEHPFVKSASAKVEAQQRRVEKLQEQASAGKPITVQLKAAEAQLETLQKSLQTTKDNVGEALAQGQEPSLSKKGMIKGQSGGLKISDWRDKDKIKQLSKVYKGLEDVGYSRIETPEKAIELAHTAPDVSQNVLQRGMNALTKGGIYLKGKVDNPVVHYAVDRLLDADNKARAEVAEKVHTAYTESVRNLSKADRTLAFELLNGADARKVALVPDELPVSQEVKDFLKTHQNMMDDVLSKINEARAAVGKKPLEAREAYSAMSMSGDFRKLAKKVARNEDGSVKLDVNGNPVMDVVGVLGSNIRKGTKNSLENLERLMKEKDPELVFVDVPSKRDITAKGTPHAAFMDALQILGDDKPQIKEFLNTLAEVAKSDAEIYRGMQKHTLGKKGVWGMEGRKPWLSADENTKAFFENQIRYAEDSYFWSHMAQAAKDVNAVLRDESLMGKQDKAIGLVENYMQNAMGINPSKVGRAFERLMETSTESLGIGASIPKSAVSLGKKLTNTALLTINAPFLALQMIQPILAMPGVASFLRGRGAAGQHTMLTGGLDYFAKSGASLMTQALGGKLSDLEKGAFDYVKKNHVYATDMVNYSTHVEKTPLSQVEKAIQYPAASLEQGTRASVFLALVHMMHDAGLTPKTGLYEQAHRFTDMAMTNYSSLEKPAFYNALGPIGSMAYNLRSFGHNELSRWSMYARELAKNKNASPILTQMATVLASAGVMGLPFYSQFEELYDYLTNALGKPRSLTNDVLSVSEALGKDFGEKGLYALSNGLPAIAGLDLSKRLGLGDVAPSKLSDAVFPGGSKLADIAGAVKDVATMRDEKALKSLVYNLTPAGLQGLLQTQWYVKNGITYSTDPKNFHPTGERTDPETVMKIIGVSGVKETTSKAKEYHNTQIEAKLAEKRKSALNDMGYAIVNNQPITKTMLDKYFEEGEGDPGSFGGVLDALAMRMNMSPQQAKMLKLSASQSLTNVKAMERRM